jgi:DNA modification methylase
MTYDLENAKPQQRKTSSRVVLGDARQLSNYFDPCSASLMITSPPYPGDHEYTKHTRLELIFRGYATNHEEFRVIKKRMLRGSTTNLYKEDNDREPISEMSSIRDLTDLIDERLTADGATSGFEGLYTKVVWEYFGGMYKALQECHQVLRPGGKIALLVSDSHAFKMVHIQTAKLLQEIGEEVGFIHPEIILWQYKVSTSHRYSLRENILVLQKPN